MKNYLFLTVIHAIYYFAVDRIPFRLRGTKLVVSRVSMSKANGQILTWQSTSLAKDAQIHLSEATLIPI